VTVTLFPGHERGSPLPPGKKAFWDFLPGHQYAQEVIIMLDEKDTLAGESSAKAFEEFKERLEGRDWKKTAENIKEYIKNNPGKAILIGVAVGFLVGYLVRRSKD